jgi:DNA-binding transcriptional ArsR family regulator
MRVRILALCLVLAAVPVVSAQDPVSDVVPAHAEAGVDAREDGVGVHVGAGYEVTDAAGIPAMAGAAAADEAVADNGVDAPSLAALLQEASEGSVAAGAQAGAGDDRITLRAWLLVDGAEPAGAQLEAPLPATPLALPSSGSAEAASPPGAPIAEPAASAHAASTIRIEVPPISGPLALAAIAATTVLAAGASSATGLATGARRVLLRALTLVGGLGLFSRLTEADLLRHPRRHEIYEYVKENPGERLEIIRRALNLPNGAMLHHVKVLDQRNLVRIIRDGGKVRLYPAGPRIQPQPYLLPVRRRLLDQLSGQPGLTQRQVARAVGLSERAVSYHVGWLAENGLVAVERSGPAKRCFPASSRAGPA